MLRLDDSIIIAGQKLLRHQFPDISGSTVAVPVRRCDVLPAGAIHIVHSQSNHWICIKVNENKSSVNLYDSKYSNIPSPVIDLILDITNYEGDVATIKSMKIQGVVPVERSIGPEGTRRVGQGRHFHKLSSPHFNPFSTCPLFKFPIIYEPLSATQIWSTTWR